MALLYLGIFLLSVSSFYAPRRTTCESAPFLSAAQLMKTPLDTCLQVFNSFSTKKQKAIGPCILDGKKVLMKMLRLHTNSEIYEAAREEKGMRKVYAIPGAMQMIVCYELYHAVIFIYEGLYMDFHQARSFYARIAPTLRYQLLLSIAKTLEAVHAFLFTHGDLKPENIMFVDGTMTTAQIIDWGLGAEEGKDYAGGTFFFMAPEISKNHYVIVQTRAMDVWMFATTLLDLLSPDILDFLTPYSSKSEVPKFVFDEGIYMQLTQRLQTFLGWKNDDIYRKMLAWIAFDPQQRATMAQVVLDLQLWGERLFALPTTGKGSNAPRKRIAAWLESIFPRSVLQLSSKIRSSLHSARKTFSTALFGKPASSLPSGPPAGVVVG